MQKFFRFLFFGFNILMLIWLLAYWRDLGQLDLGSDASRAGATIGAAIGSGMIMALWGMGALILGLLVLVTRGERLVATGDAAAVRASRRSWPWIGGAAGIGFLIVWAIAAPSDTSGDRKRSQPTEQKHDNPDPAAAMRLSNLSWTGDFAMMASFTIINDNPYPVKDVEVKCDHTAPSGTRIDSNTRTIYQRFEPLRTRQIRDFNMGFIHSQAVRSSCRITKAMKAG